MPIRQMINTREQGTVREFQQRLHPVGKVRLGVFVTPEGKRGRPEKIDTFRFTSPTESLIRGAAELYGGTVEQWTPQGAKMPQWEVVSEAKALPVYLVHGQNIDPNYEAWGGGRTCLRRCDGVWNRIGGDDGTGTPCVCNGPTPPADRDLCKITLRVQLMLQELPGIGSWLLETHGENATAEISSYASLVKHAPMPVPAMMRLREESRREWNPNKQPKAGFESRSFYVPWFDISALTMRQVAIGGDALTQALAAAGAPMLGARAPRPALESAPPTPAEQQQMALENQMHASMVADGVAAGEIDTGLAAIAAKQGIAVDEVRTRILRDIEAAYTLDALMEIKNKLTSRGVGDQRVRDAWNGRKNAVKAAAEVGGSAPGPADQRANANHQRALRAQQERITESHHMNDAVITTVREAKREAQAHVRQVLDGEPTPDEMSGPVDPNYGDPPPDWAVPEYAVGDTVTVGGIEFTKIADDAQAFGSDVDTSPVLTLDEEWAVLFATVPAWPTGEVHERIRTFCGVEKSSQATAEQLHALTAAIRRGEVR